MVHSISRDKEPETAYKYKEVSAMYNEISPPLSVLLLIDDKQVLNISSGNQNAFMKTALTPEIGCSNNKMKYFL